MGGWDGIWTTGVGLGRVGRVLSDWHMSWKTRVSLKMGWGEFEKTSMSWAPGLRRGRVV